MKETGRRIPLREKCPNKEFFWSVFSVYGLNTGKYGPNKTPYLDTFHTLYFILDYFSVDWDSIINDDTKDEDLSFNIFLRELMLF